MIKTKVGILVLGIVLLASAGWAQDWKGSGRMSGKVTDEQGKPLEGVRVTASLDTFANVIDATTDKRGDWGIDGIADGNWVLIFEKDGYDPAKGNADVNEGLSGSSVRTKMKKSFDPNAFIKEQVTKAEDLMAQKKYAEARAVYEGIIKKVPQVEGPMQVNLARTYYGEGKIDAAVEAAKKGVAATPGNAQTKLLLLNMLVTKGSFDEASQLLGTIDESAITEPVIYLNFGSALINAKRPEDALQYLNKAVARFPQAPQPYYYRANALIEILNTKKDPKDPARADLVTRIKADLNKFLQISPAGPEAEQVKQLLEQISK